jgi:hypothetical protein
LKEGIWYNNDYYKALADLAPTNPSVQARLDFFKKRDFFYQCYPPKDLFIQIPAESDTGFQLASMELKQGVQPSQALDGLIKEKRLAFLDCLQLVQIACFQAIREVLGSEKFDKLYNHDSRLDNDPVPLRIGAMNTLHPFIKELKTTEPTLIGQMTGASNVQDYQIKHQIMGMCGNINLLLAKSAATATNSSLSEADVDKTTAHTPSQKKYVGFGVDPDGATEEQIEEMLVKEHNAPPFDDNALSDEFISKTVIGGREYMRAFRDYLTCQSKSNRQKIYNVFAKHNTRKADTERQINSLTRAAKTITRDEAKKDPAFGCRKINVIDFNVELIQKLIELPLAEVSMNFVQKFCIETGRFKV